MGQTCSETTLLVFPRDGSGSKYLSGNNLSMDQKGLWLVVLRQVHAFYSNVLISFVLVFLSIIGFLWIKELVFYGVFNSRKTSLINKLHGRQNASFDCKILLTKSGSCCRHFALIRKDMHSSASDRQC